MGNSSNKNGDKNGCGNIGAGIKLTSSSGSLIGGEFRDKHTRISETMADFCVASLGVRECFSRQDEPNLLVHASRAYARAASIFLRKTVLGYQNKAKTRLLDDTLIKSSGIHFDKVRKIPKESRRTIRSFHNPWIMSGHLQAKESDKQSHKVIETYHLHTIPHIPEFLLEWPVPGFADWRGIPSMKRPWFVDAGQLFQNNPTPEMSCDEWLGQQVVQVNSKSICLREIIQTVANYDGAHSINTGRLFTPEGHEPSKASKKPEVHILNGMNLFYFRYLDVIVIECAIYILRKLIASAAIRNPFKEMYIAVPCIACTAGNEVTLSHPSWLHFVGTHTFGLSEKPISGVYVHRFRIRCPQK